MPLFRVMNNILLQLRLLGEKFSRARFRPRFGFSDTRRLNFPLKSERVRRVCGSFARDRAIFRDIKLASFPSRLRCGFVAIYRMQLIKPIRFFNLFLSTLIKRPFATITQVALSLLSRSCRPTARS